MDKLRVFGLALTILISGCASYGVVQNTPISVVSSAKSYSLKAWSERPRNSEIEVILAFSGGGTRAAALSYGVLQELRDTRVTVDGNSARLLDEVASITSVSGGSFTAAYYGLYGDRIFTDFESVFLRRNVEKALTDMLFNPLRWFVSTGRTDWSVDYYQEHIFHGATFADMLQPGRPLIVINASDLGYGVRFSFLQEYFNLLCSDLSSFPIARAVAASSAVPVVFNPVVIENYPNCGTKEPDWLLAAKKRAGGDPERTQLIAGLETYLDKGRRKYVHFVDGGITDNLGLRAILDIIEMADGVKSYLGRLHSTPPRRIVIIAVNASTDIEPVMDLTNKQPPLEETINAMSSVQLHRYNATTIESMKQSLARWEAELSTPEKPLTPYFIQVTFADIPDPDRRIFFNKVPTSFDLTDEQVDRLIEAGRQLLRDNPEFRNLLSDLKR